jgi:hypothetical protein
MHGHWRALARDRRLCGHAQSLTHLGPIRRQSHIQLRRLHRLPPDRVPSLWQGQGLSRFSGRMEVLEVSRLETQRFTLAAIPIPLSIRNQLALPPTKQALTRSAGIAVMQLTTRPTENAVCETGTSAIRSEQNRGASGATAVGTRANGAALISIALITTGGGIMSIAAGTGTTITASVAILGISGGDVRHGAI